MTNNKVSIPFNHQQIQVLQSLVIETGEVQDLTALIHLALLETPFDLALTLPQYVPIQEKVRKVVTSEVLQPGTGKGFVVKQGQIIRIKQIDGGQCADFNCFNLHNTLEVLQAGKTRMLHGVSPKAGDLLWSKAPWERPMMKILHSNAVTDALYPCCSPRYYQTFYKTDQRTNCQQMQEDAQREFGIIGSQSHESLNLFMNVQVEQGGHSHITHNSAKAGDFIELYAYMDVLCSINICGDDLSPCNNFDLNTVLIEIFESDDDEKKTAEQTYAHFLPLTSTRHQNITAQPAVKDENYLANFPFKPLSQPVEIELFPEHIEKIKALAHFQFYQENLAETLRDVVMTWLMNKVHRV